MATQATTGVGPITGPPILSGEGSPEGVVKGIVGTIYRRLDGSASAGILYLKESGVENTGWTVLDAPLIQTQYTEQLSTVQLAEYPALYVDWTVTAGTFVMSATITPLYSTSRLLIDANGIVDTWRSGTSGAASAAFWLCRAGTTVYIAESWVQGYGDGSLLPWQLRFIDIPGAGTWTYTMRGGRSRNVVSPATTFDGFVNGYNWNSTGSKFKTCMTIQEIK